MFKEIAYDMFLQSVRIPLHVIAANYAGALLHKCSTCGGGFFLKRTVSYYVIGILFWWNINKQDLIVVSLMYLMCIYSINVEIVIQYYYDYFIELQSKIDFFQIYLLIKNIT